MFALLAAASYLAAPADGTSLASLSLDAAFTSTVNGMDCPAGTPNTTSCYADHGTAPVSGLGNVTETFTETIDGATSCTHTTFGPAVLAVAGKGELDATLTDPNTCDPPNTSTIAVPFTITGGTGPYAGATGGGTLTFSDFRPTGATSAKETHTWAGQATANTTFDTTPPTISGARPITIETRRSTARAHYTLTATDAVDGAVSVTCNPRSGSRFKIGRTLVTCSATDSSDNTATTRFTVRVKRLR